MSFYSLYLSGSTCVVFFPFFISFISFAYHTTLDNCYKSGNSHSWVMSWKHEGMRDLLWQVWNHWTEM